MADKRTLFSGPLSLFGAKVDIALREKQLICDVIMVPFSEDNGYSPKNETVLRVNHKKQVPVLIDGNVELFDSTQIFEYLEDAYPQLPLWPREVAARAKARQLELMADEVYFAHVIPLFSLQNERQGEAAQTAYAALHRFHQDMEKRLADQAFLGGEFSYSDIAFFMAHLFADRMGCPLNADTPKLIDWRDRMAARASIQDTLKPMQAYLKSVSRYFPEWVYLS
jgi:glutathione S-transferase